MFLRCDANHHSLAFLGVPGRGLQHAAFDVRGREELSRGIYFLGDRGVKRVHGPGRHGPGEMLFTYYQDPERNVIEYCTEIQQVDERLHQPRVWAADKADNLWRTNEHVGPPAALSWTMHLLPAIRRLSRLMPARN